MSQALSDDCGAVLLAVATDAIASELEGRSRREPVDDAAQTPELRRAAASFVSLHRKGALLGCIGSIEPHRGLVDDVAYNAVAAAFRDPRLPPITPDDYETMDIEVSVLSPLEPMRASSYEELERIVTPGVDGLLVRAGRHRATLLPSVWEQPGPGDTRLSAQAFVALLWRKAGLAARSWPAGTTVERYSTQTFSKDGPRPPIEGKRR